MDRHDLPHRLGDLAEHPSLAPRCLIAAGRATGIALAAGVGLGVASLAWGSLERRFPVIRRYDLPIPAYRGIGPLRILQISDLHMYPGQDFLVDFLHRVAATEKIDMVISTGDNLGSTDGLALARAAHEPFLHLPGAFVLGSNDYYSPRRRPWSHYLWRDSRDLSDRTTPDLPWRDLVQTLCDAGWKDLSNRSSVLHVPLPSSQTDQLTVALLGVDDPHLDRDRLGDPVPEWADDSTLRLGVTHAPYRRVVNAFTDAGADLVLAGHTHGGQFGLPGYGALVTNCDLPRAFGKGMNEWHTRGGRTVLHVSAGLGTSPFVPFRIATRPEVSIIHVRPY